MWGTTQIGWICDCLVRVHKEPHRLRGSIKAWQECVEPRAGKDGVCNLYKKMLTICPGVFETYTPCSAVHRRYFGFSVCHVTRFGSVIPEPLCAPCWLPPVNQNGGGGEKHIFLPTSPPSAALSSLNRRLQVILQLCLTTVCCQIICLNIYRET